MSNPDNSPLSYEQFKEMGAYRRFTSKAYSRLTPDAKARIDQENKEREERLRKEEAEEKAAMIRRDIEQTLPGAYLRDGFKISKHPSPEAHSLVMDWKPGRQGLLIHGGTGKGKTRSMLQLLQRLISEGHGVRFTEAPKLADAIAAKAFSNVGEFDSFLRDLETVRVLAVDDLGAWKPTERVAGSIHRIIDSRYSAGLPIIATTNCNPQELQAKLLDEHGRTIRRLQESTKAIHF